MYPFAATGNTKDTLYKEVNLPAEFDSVLISKLAALDHRYLKDLKVNVSNALKSGTLSRKEALLIALSVAVNEKNAALISALEELLKTEGAEDKEIAEVTACVSLMNANNVFYRFRHFMHKEFYDNAPAGIKMSIMVNPVLGKEFFELLSLVVSALNGCEMCVTSHEQSVLNHGGTQARIFDAVRVGAIFKSFSVLL
ncbi:carboxymuconolactone decarboxylase family protein [Dyadobacter sp. CY343]|uniref:carboxymuconolactone decarboxylase family protein n=1 Tax=Dyadobacter sp. CY343 TaxID=2907299 RepID=UPI001F38197D|nr:carboxymuconolactone decarboxylase family protein [Dyadobacter sp. CY343]MCE7058549.1 carboxymuconolactone decarboxylase family protein [Dyadobacter sp. CY343]